MTRDHRPTEPDEERIATGSGAIGGDPASELDQPTVVGASGSKPDAHPGGETAVTDPSGAAIPERLGRFDIIRLLGRGGMGAVYLGKDRELGRLVAVKVLPPEFAQRADLLMRFEREQTAITRLDHPGIVPVFGIGEEAGLRFFAMRYVDGAALDDHLVGLRASDADSGSKPGREFRLKPEGLAEILHIIERTARSLHHAHTRGIVHRDVKPSNVMIDREGNPQLLDFGIAKLTMERQVTQHGVVMGTIPYMSPEQVSGEVEEIDARSDLYSLGATLYECVTGRLPFDAEEPRELMIQIVSHQPPDPRALNPQVSQDIETVTLKCLEKNPARRYQTCLQLAEELANIRAHRRIDAEPVGRLGRLARWAERNRTLAGVGLAAVIGLLLVLAVSLLGVYEKRQARLRRAAAELTLAREARRELDALDQAHQKLEADLGDLVVADGDEAIRRQRFEIVRDAARQDQRRAALPARIASFYDRSLQAADDAAVRRERDEFLFLWYLRAELAGDRATVGALAARLVDGVWGERLTGRGRVTLVTDPPGARVGAIPYVDSGDGRLRLDHDHAVEIGATPLAGVALEAGSWLLLLSREGSHEVRYPVTLARDEHWGAADWQGGAFADHDWTIRLVGAESYDGGTWARVARGPFRSDLASDPASKDAPTSWRWAEDYLISRREVTQGQYLDFLGETLVVEQIAAAVAVPGAKELPYLPKGHFEGKAVERLRVDFEGEVIGPHALEPSLAEGAGRAVCGLRQGEAADYAEWLGDIRGVAISLPTGIQWEKAARGVDGRRHPWGDGFDWSFTAGRRSSEQPLTDLASALEPGRFPVDESPYAVLDLAGNVSEWAADGKDGGFWLCGGNRSANERLDFVTWPWSAAPANLWTDFSGIRLIRPLP